MKNILKWVRTSATFAPAAFAAAASPMAMADSGWYLGGNVGQSNATIDQDRISSGLLGNGFTVTAFDEDDSDVGYKLFAGYQFGRYFALEGGYFDLGAFDFTATTLPAGSLSGELEVQGFNLDAVGILPLTERLSAFARIGANQAKAKVHYSGSGAANVLNPDRRKSDVNYKAGVGLEYDITSSLSARLEWERYRIDDAVGNQGDIDLTSLGLLYRFGKKSQGDAPQPVIAAAPANDVAAAPAPARKFSLSADSLFDFDQALIKPAGKQELDRLAADLKGTDFDVIVVTGHADRIGTQDYNHKLSQRRAEAVKDYLVQAGGIPASKIAARGVDEADPVTQPGQCQGEQATPQHIACLQPDRRVEVEVTGTK